MWFKLALVLLGFWLTHVTGLLPLGPLAHVLLLGGLATLLLSFVTARETAIRDSNSRAGGGTDTRHGGQ